MNELVWVTVPKFPEYEINQDLEVRRKSTGRIIKCYNNEGYLKLNLSLDGKEYKRYLHQLVAWAFVPNPDNKPEIHHIDCDPLNNHWTNLQWVTKVEHKELSKQNGQFSHKLKAADVIFVRDNYTPQYEHELAEKYDVSKQTIYLIATGQARKDIKEGKIHETKGVTKKIIDIKTGEIFKSVDLVAIKTGLSVKTLRRSLSGERYNKTNFRYLGEEHLFREKPQKRKIIPFIPHSFGVIVPKERRLKSKNPRALWKKVIQCDLQGNQIAEYASVREAARIMGAWDHKMLQKLLKGKRGKTFKGFKWKYADSDKVV